MSNPRLLIPTKGVARWNWAPTRYIGVDPQVVRDAVLAQLAKLQRLDIPQQIG